MEKNLEKRFKVEMKIKICLFLIISYRYSYFIPIQLNFATTYLNVVC